MLQQERSARKQALKRTNRSYGDLVKIATEISGRSKWTVYAVLAGRAKSEPVERAIAAAMQQIGRTRRRAA